MSDFEVAVLIMLGLLVLDVYSLCKELERVCEGIKQNGLKLEEIWLELKRR